MNYYTALLSGLKSTDTIANDKRCFFACVWLECVAKNYACDNRTWVENITCISQASGLRVYGQCGGIESEC